MAKKPSPLYYHFSKQAGAIGELYFCGAINDGEPKKNVFEVIISIVTYLLQLSPPLIQKIIIN